MALFISITMSMSGSLSPPLSDEMEYENVLKDILRDNGTLKESLAYFGCHNIYDFLSFSLVDINTLTKTVSAEGPTPGVTTRSTAAAQTTISSPIWVPLLLGEKNILKAFKGYIW